MGGQSLRGRNLFMRVCFTRASVCFAAFLPAAKGKRNRRIFFRLGWHPRPYASRTRWPRCVCVQRINLFSSSSSPPNSNSSLHERGIRWDHATTLKYLSKYDFLIWKKFNIGVEGSVDLYTEGRIRTSVWRYCAEANSSIPRFIIRGRYINFIVFGIRKRWFLSRLDCVEFFSFFYF